MRIPLNKICKSKDRIWNKIKMDFEKICKCSFKFLKNGDGSSTAMLILQQTSFWAKNLRRDDFL
jgi:hypothetical protein